jgi:hypothetical protein
MYYSYAVPIMSPLFLPGRDYTCSMFFVFLYIIQFINHTFLFYLLQQKHYRNLGGHCWLAVHQAAICQELTKNLPLPQKTVKLKLKQLIGALDQPLILHM